jgi:hypothetical protein
VRGVRLRRPTAPKCSTVSLESRAESTSELVTRESGMPISSSRLANGALRAALFKSFATLIIEEPGEEVRLITRSPNKNCPCRGGMAANDVCGTFSDGQHGGIEICTRYRRHD